MSKTSRGGGRRRRFNRERKAYNERDAAHFRPQDLRTKGLYDEYDNRFDSRSYQQEDDNDGNQAREA